MVALNSKFDILRGWPNSSAVQEDFVIGGVNFNKHRQGEWVSLQDKNDGSMVTDDAAVSSAADKSCYIIIEGLDDHSSKFANRVTCLLGGGYMVRIPETAPDAYAGGSSYRCFAAGVTAANFVVGQYAAVVGSVLSPLATRAAGDAVGQIIARDVNNGTVDLLVF